MEQLTLIGLPLATRSNNMGMATAVKVLRGAGIADGLREHQSSLRDVGDVPISRIEEDVGPKNLTNFSQFVEATKAIHAAIKELELDGMMFGVGGECSICMGTVAGLKEKIKGNPGMVWIDAHGDFNTPDTTPSGYIGGMCLAFACGRGSSVEVVRGGEKLLTAGNVVHFASRALDPEESRNMSSSGMRIYPMSSLRIGDVAGVVGSAVSSVADRSDWIACHLDVDSLDPTIMPAVNFPESGGLTLGEAKTIVRAVQGTGKFKLFELAGYNPDLDADRTCARKLVEFVSDVFQPIH